MASLKEVKGRINSVQNTRKITSAMRMVASSKLHKAQAAIDNMLPYQQHLSGMLAGFLACEPMLAASSFVEVREVKRVAIIAFSSNSSLCGGYNANVVKSIAPILAGYARLNKEDILIFPIGRKIADAVKKMGYEPQGDFEELAEKPSYEEMASLASRLTKSFLQKEVDRVELVYHHLHSVSSQILTHEVFLPIDTSVCQPSAGFEKGFRGEYIVEPTRVELLKRLLPTVLRMKLFTVLLDANASEHAARMISMQTATDNADGLLQDLNVAYNKMRQQAITSELLDIIGGSFQ